MAFPGGKLPICPYILAPVRFHMVNELRLQTVVPEKPLVSLIKIQLTGLTVSIVTLLIDLFRLGCGSNNRSLCPLT